MGLFAGTASTRREVLSQDISLVIALCAAIIGLYAVALGQDRLRLSSPRSPFPSCRLVGILILPIKNVLQRQSRIHSEPGRLYRNVFRHDEARCRAAPDQTERCLPRSAPARA